MRDGKAHEIAVGDIVTWGTPSEPRQGPQILLADGGLLVADVLDSDEERLSVDSPIAGKLSLPLEQIAGIVFHPPLDARRRDELMQRALASTRHDLLILDNGDEVSGTLLAVAAKEVQLKAAAGTLKIETDRILALAFDTSLLETPRTKGSRLVVGFSDGSRVLATSFVISDGKAQLTLSSGQKLNAPVEQIVFLQALGGRAEYLSDLKPAGYKHVPFLELPWQFQLDRNVQGHLTPRRRSPLSQGCRHAQRQPFDLPTEWSAQTLRRRSGSRRPNWFPRQRGLPRLCRRRAEICFADHPRR